VAIDLQYSNFALNNGFYELPLASASGPKMMIGNGFSQIIYPQIFEIHVLQLAHHIHPEMSSFDDVPPD